jgi:hypothetical protein
VGLLGRLGLALLLLAAAAPARAELPTRIELYTMGSGDDVFEAFGHSALCVIDERQPRGVCYNYGTSDFSDPVKLVWDVLRGRARFWVGRMPLPLMLQAYTEDDRSIWRQKLELDEATARALAARLEDDLLPENKYYTYHHYRDNCATRLRDHIDWATGGRLSAGTERGSGQTFRGLTQRGFASDILLLLGMEVVVGRRVDREATIWEAMFVPAVMRAEVARRFQAPPEAYYTRVGPVPTLSPHAGTRALWAAALIVALLVLSTAVSRAERPLRVALAVLGVTLGLLGALVVVVAVVATLPELRQNEVLLVVLPTDVLLALLRGRALYAYLVARLILAAAVAAGLAAGMVVAPIWPIWAFATAPMAIAAVRLRARL